MIADPAARAHVAAVWGVDPDTLPGPGVPAVELLARLGTPGGPRALLVHGANLVVSAPNVSAVREALGRLDLLVVGDFVPSETAQLADVVLPVTQWAEEEGTMTTLEGRVVRRRRAVDPPGEARTRAVGLGAAGAPLRPPPQRRRPRGLRRARPRLAPGAAPTTRRSPTTGSTRARSCSGPARRAVPEGTPRLFLDRFATDDGRAHLVAVDHHGPADDVTADDAGAPRHRPACCTTTSRGRRPAGWPSSSRPLPALLLELHPAARRHPRHRRGRRRARHVRPR